LNDKINEGLKNCGHAVIVLSPSFLKNYGWPRREFTSLVRLSLQKRQKGLKEKCLIPIWRGVTSDEVIEYDPSLADIVAHKTTLSDNFDQNEVQEIARKIVNRIRG
jgi:hypothetical protein